jgi:hypothetical protein
VTEILAVILLGWGLLVVWVALGAMRYGKRAKERLGAVHPRTVETWLADPWRWER